MKKKNLGIGRENFKDLIENNFYYVDKTKAIEELLDKQSYLSLFPRPRRFGKTLFLSMLNNFFNIEYKDNNKNLFNNLYISKSKYYKELSTSPVISISFKGLKGNSYEEIYCSYKEQIRKLYENKYYIREILREAKKVVFDKFLNKTADTSEYKDALQILSEFMYDYYKKQIIILIDEYDVPIQEGYIKGFYKEVINLIKGVFSSALKTNDYLRFSVLTGVLRVSRESLFSDLNNIKIYSVVDTSYNEYFGFTEGETKELLEYYDLELDDRVKEMYDGYNFNGVEIFNPWSIINYASDKILDYYWVNTSGNNLIMDLLPKAREDVKLAIEKLLLGRSVLITYNNKITYMDLNKESTYNVVMNFLLICGYLTLDYKGVSDIINGNEIEVRLPNNEVRSMFINMLKSITYDEFNIELSRDFTTSFVNDDKEKIESILNKMMMSMSFYDTKENFYHGYMLGLFTNFLMNDKYIVKSNRESGSGRFDLMIESIDRELGIIIEFKIALDKNIEETAYKALNQMESKEYYKELELDKVETIYKYAIIFYDGKKCIVR